MSCWLSDVTITFPEHISKSVVVEIVAGRHSPSKTLLETERSHVYNHKFRPALEFGPGEIVSVKLTQKKTLRSKVISESSFPYPCVNSTYDDGQGHTIALNVITDTALQDLAAMCTEFPHKLENALEHVRRAISATGSTLTLAAAVRELHPVVQSTASLVIAVDKCLREQERDKDIRDLAQLIHIIFAKTEKAKKATSRARWLLTIMSNAGNLFTESVKFMLDYCTDPAAVRNARAKTQPAGKDRLDQLRRQLDIFGRNFDRAFLAFFNNASGVPMNTAILESTSLPLPCKPVRMFGRVAELNTMVTTLSGPAPRLVVHGDEGTGKTTLALWCIYEERVDVHYESALFVPCEGTTTLPLLIEKLVDVLEIQPFVRNVSRPLLDRIVLRSLAQQQRLLCLDNFEALWGSTEGRPQIEGFLQLLHSIPTLGLIITMREIECPLPDLPWTRIPPLAPLPFGDAIEMFEDVAGNHIDEPGRRLIAEVRCIPLVIILIAGLSRDQSTTGLLESRRKLSTTTMQTNSTDRGSSVDGYISLSMISPSIQKNPLTKAVLSMIALLPDGLSGHILDALMLCVPVLDIHDALDTLRRMGLLMKEEDRIGTGCRYRVLPPIRRWCSKHLVSGPLKNALYQTYREFVMYNHQPGSVEETLVVKPEFCNIGEVLLRAFEDNFSDPTMWFAAISYDIWSMRLGRTTTAVIRQAIIHTDRSRQADCSQQLGRHLMLLSELDEAETMFVSALVLHQQAGDVISHGDDSSQLGQLYLMRGELDKAETALISALELHRQAQSVIGQADDLRHVGELYLLRGKLDEAETAFTSALELHRQVQDVSSQESDLEQLGKLYLQRGQFDEAETAIKSALELNQQTLNILNRSRHLGKLGWIYKQRGEVDEAETALTSALELYQQTQDLSGQATNLVSLGSLYMQQGNLDKAETALTSTLELYQCLNDLSGEAYSTHYLGLLYTRQKEFSKGEQAFEAALKTHRHVNNSEREKWDLEDLGELRARREEFETAQGSASVANEGL